jgi:hypothetical protein
MKVSAVMINTVDCNGLNLHLKAFLFKINQIVIHHTLYHK